MIDSWTNAKIEKDNERYVVSNPSQVNKEHKYTGKAVIGDGWVFVNMAGKLRYQFYEASSI